MCTTQVSGPFHRTNQDDRRLAECRAVWGPVAAAQDYITAENGAKIPFVTAVLSSLKILSFFGFFFPQNAFPTQNSRSRSLRKMPVSLNALVVVVVGCFFLVYPTASKRTLAPLKTIRERNALRYFTQLSDKHRFMESILPQLLRVRVPGTPGSAKVRHYIVDYLKALSAGWKVELDSFVDNTPIGHVEFSNIVATLNPLAPRRLVMACHYDSKNIPGFVGATDAAVSCAMLLDMARTLDVDLAVMARSNVTLQLIFFDGEEAFRTWTPSDSLYGSRHLAEKMESTPHPLSKSSQSVADAPESELEAIDTFVLLDLLGAEKPVLMNFFEDTSYLYRELKNIETRLTNQELLHSKSHTETYFFGSGGPFSPSIEDDHIPFLNRGVPVLHMIAVPFPSVWHTIHDNRNGLWITAPLTT